MNLANLARNIKTALLTAAFFLALVSTTFLQILVTPHSALAYSNTYPSSIGGCRAVSGSPSGYFTCDLKDSTQDEYFDPWGEENRECTSYAAWMLSSVNGFTMPFFDDAVNWGTDASNMGYIVNMTPAPGSIYWSSTHDHVAWVVSVNSSAGTVDTVDYNSGYPTNPGQWNEEPNQPISSASGYIHFKDITSTSNPGLGGGNGSTWATGRLDGWIEQSSPTNGSNLGHIWFNGAWQPWETIGAPNNELMASQPAAVSWSYGTTPNRIDVFAQGQSNDLIQTYYDGTSWHQWTSLGGCISGTPTVTSWGVGRLDIFAKACTASNGSNLVHIWYNNGAWQPWEYISENQLMTSTPSAVAWGSGRIDVFAAGTSSALVHTWYDVTTGGWNQFENLGGCLTGAPAASSWGPGRLDGFVEGCNGGGNFYHIYYDVTTGGWHAFENVSNTYQISGVLGAVSWGNGRIDMFTRRSDNTLDHWWFSGSWGGPENKGGSIAP